MKTISALICGLVFAAFPFAASAQQSAFKIDKITPNFIESPQFQIGNAAHQAPQGSTAKWLEVEVQFESAVDADELTVNYYVALSVPTSTTALVLPGSVTHVNVSKGQELYSVMYVPPQAILKLMSGQPATINAVKAVGIELAVKGQVVARKSSKGGLADLWWTQMQQTAGMLLNKNQTPFAPLYWDRYLEVKPSEH